MTTIRNFDALNDVNNLIDSGKSITAHGLKHEVVVTMMELPPGCSGAHTVEFYMKTLQDILDAEIPFDSVCFKDASGTAVPKKVYDTIVAARKVLPGDTKIAFHSHETAGIGTVGYVAAIKAGADQVDCSLAPASGGTCQPDVATLWHALRGEDYELDVDIDKMMEAAAVFKDCMKDYVIPPEAKAVEPMIPWSPMPGGALTANTQMMRDNDLMDKYEDCIAAMSESGATGVVLLHRLHRFHSSISSRHLTTLFLVRGKNLLKDMVKWCWATLVRRLWSRMRRLSNWQLKKWA